MQFVNLAYNKRMENNFWKSWKGVTLIIAIVLVAYLGFTYNSFVTLNENIKGQWAQVETQYQRRFDLIPNLMETVKGVMGQEQAVYGALAKARESYLGAKSSDEKAAAATQVESAFGKFLVVMENYPTLNSYQPAQNLQIELAGTENRVAVERQRYNDEVRGYNTKVQRFPSSLIAKIFGFNIHAYFEVSKEVANAPKVKF